MAVSHRELEPYLEKLRALPFVRDASVAALAHRVDGIVLDARIVVATPSEDVELSAELKRSTLTREIAERLVHLGSRVPHVIVLAPAIGRDVGDLFAGHGIDFVDLAGNCHVHVADRYLARIQGQRAAPRAVTERALRAPTVRVLFALLADPELARATTRTLASAAGGVSPQTASDVRAKLLGEGALLRTRGGLRWAPSGWKRALETFLVGFPTLLPSLVIGRYRTPWREAGEVERNLAPHLDACGEWRWGGGAAASRLDGHYRGEQTIVYFRDPAIVIPRELPLVPDPRGSLALLRAPGPLALEGPRPDCVHPLLVYADLLIEGHERAREAAAAVHDRYLVPVAEHAA